MLRIRAVAYDVIEGALATLRKVSLSKQLHERFQKPALFMQVGMQKAPDYELLRELTDEQELIVWNIHPGGKAASTGFALFAAFNGPPFVVLHFFDPAKIDLEVGRDVLLELIHYFFQNTEEEALFFYQPKPAPEAVHELLVEGGFDLFDDNPTLDPDESCYVLERYTYDAYYGEEKGGREGEFDNYEEEEVGPGGDDE